MFEVLNYYEAKINGSDVLQTLELKEQDYFVVSAHREENIDSEVNFADLLDSLKTIAEKYNKPIIVSTHPRTRKRLEELGIESLHNEIQFLRPLGFLDYINLQMNAFCVISDSGTITEESSLLNFPAITIRQAHERPEGMDEGTLIMCGLKADRVMQSIDVVTSQHSSPKRQFKLVDDYDAENVSKKVVRIILSYTDYVNRVTWHK